MRLPPAARPVPTREAALATLAQEAGVVVALLERVGAGPVLVLIR